MPNLEQIFAKSKQNAGVPLMAHTLYVRHAIRIIAGGMYNLFDVSLAEKGAVLHDLGKAHPHFQNKMQQINKRTLASQRESNNNDHRHELSSLAFLPAFPTSEWNVLIDMVVAHHKSIKNDYRNKGILDLDETRRDWIEYHLKDWDIWSSAGKQILEECGYSCPTITKEQATSALKYTLEYCESKKNGWSPWRGLLKAADHFASAFNDLTESHLQNLFEVPELSFYRDDSRKSRLFPLSQTDGKDHRKHTLVVAPTGAGKTDFLLKRTKGRVFYTLPFQASINAMWARFKETIPNKDIRLLHASSRIVAGINVNEQILQPLVGSSVKVMTPHQLAAIIFGISGFETILLDIQGCDIILDEIHTYSDFSRAMVLEIVKALKYMDCRIHIGSATMPTVLYKALLEILGGPNQVYEVKLPAEALDEFDRHIIYKHEDDKDINDVIRESLVKREKLLVIFNTVKKAQQALKEYERLFPGIPKMLIHSRFKRGDRVELERRLKYDFNGKESDSYSPCIVVATQVVEVSLDISFDRMITECAPLDSLIQRFGRINRIRTVSTLGKYKPVHIIAPFGNVLPYKMEVLKKSFSMLPDSGEILRERSLQEKIDMVYPYLDMKEIDVHLKFRDGNITLKELTDNRKSVLIEALEIEGATCILEADRDIYLSSTWEQRVQMEIPVSWKAISGYKSEYEQLEVGSNPFVVPQIAEEYELFGLQLRERDNFL